MSLIDTLFSNFGNYPLKIFGTALEHKREHKDVLF
jgi:hypothetical protein